MLEAKDTGETNTKKNDVRLEQAPETPALLTQIMSLKEGKMKKKLIGNGGIFWSP